MICKQTKNSTEEKKVYIMPLSIHVYSKVWKQSMVNIK